MKTTIYFLDNDIIKYKGNTKNYWHSKMDLSFSDFKFTIPKAFRHLIESFSVPSCDFQNLTIEKNIEIYKAKKYLNLDSKLNDLFNLDEIINVYIDLDNTLLMYEKLHNSETKKHPDIIYPQSKYGFFLNLKPFDNAINVVKRLINDNRFNVVFATAPAIYSPFSYTEKRVSIEKFFSLEDCERLVIINDKGLLTGHNSILIDDLKKGRGQEMFSGKQIVFGDLFNNWSQIEDFFYHC